MRSVFVALLLFAFLLTVASEAHGYDYWNQIRHSATLPDGRVTIRAENPAGAGVQNLVLFASAGIQETPMTSTPDGPSTIEGTVPGPTTLRRYYGFRLLQGAELDLMPVRLLDGSTPSPQDLTRVAADPAGDDLFGLTHLDLVDCRVSFNGSTLFAVLKNAGGGFPVSSGLTFYGYLLGIADPALANPTTVFAMMYTFNQPGIIGPGLYKVTGTGLDDLEKIGDVSYSFFPSENALLLSCELADLLADSYFMSWYDPSDPCVAVAGFTQRITLLNGAEEADRTPGGDCYLRELAIDPMTNHLPTLQGLQIVGSGANAYAQVVYADADRNCPVLSEIRFGSGPPYPMRPVSLDYAAPVTYRSGVGIPPFVQGGWTQARARFSDNQADIVEALITVTDAPDATEIDLGLPLRVSCAPNPFSDEVKFLFEGTPARSLRVTILDAAGRTVAVLTDQEAAGSGRILRWNGQDRLGRPVPSGAFLWRAERGLQTATGTMIRIR